MTHFLEGEITYLSEHWMEGIALMKGALENADPEAQLGREKFVLAEALGRHGVKADEPMEAALYAEALLERDTIELALMRRVIKLMLRQAEFGALIRLTSALEKPNACFIAAKILSEFVDKDNTLPFRIGTSYTRLLRIAASSVHGQPAERAQLIAQAEAYEKKFPAIS